MHPPVLPTVLWLPELKIAGVLTSLLFMELVLLWPGLLEASLLSCGMDVAREIPEGGMLL